MRKFFITSFSNIFIYTYSVSNMKVKKLLKQLKGYEGFKDVLQAIQMVAASDLKEIKTDLNVRFNTISPFIPYFYITEEFENLTCNYYAVFPITIDKNCCGPHNFNIFKATDIVIDGISDSGSDFMLVTSGMRSRNFFLNKYPKKKIKQFFNIDREYLSTLVTNILIDKLLLLENVDKFIIVFNRFYNVFDLICSTYEIPNYHFFLKNLVILEKISLKSSLIISVLQYENLKDLYLFAFSMLLLDALEENEYCAIAGRINSMSSAYKNIQDLILHISLVYNKARQEQITNELMEVSIHTII